MKCQKSSLKSQTFRAQALHQWQMNDFQITRDNNRCVRENLYPRASIIAHALLLQQTLYIFSHATVVVTCNLKIVHLPLMKG